jgi:putative ABC transport system permease protein
MKFLRVLLSRIGALFRSRELDADLDEEIRSHLELLEREYIRGGMNAKDAQYAARREFGGATQIKEIYREQRTLSVVGILGQDLRYSVRTLRNSPTFAALGILTLALGIGVNTAVFSAVNAIVLRSLPYVDADRLVALWETFGQNRNERRSVAPANLPDYQRQNRVFTDMAGYALVSRNLTESGPPQRLWAEQATWNLLSVLGVRPERGRAFLAAEDRPGNDHEVIVSHEFWQKQFGSDPNILGQKVKLDGEPYRIIGVLPPGFKLPNQFGLADPIVLYLPAAYPADLLASHGDHEIQVVARLKPDISLPRAQANLDRISEWLAKTYPGSRETRAQIGMLRDHVTRDVRTSLLVLLAAVAVVWLVACVNIANLLLARAITRQREIAVRVALGASRLRIITGLVVFSLVLASAGCFSGLVLGVGLERLLIKLAPADIPRLHAVHFDWRVFTVMSLLSAVSGVLFGLFPAWHVSKTRPGESLKTSERAFAGTAVMRWRGALTTSEIALSLILLVGSGLLLKSFVLLNAVDLGFETEHVLAAVINLPSIRYATADERLAFFEQLETRVGAIPSVVGVGFANHLPLRGGWGGGLQIDAVNSPSGGLAQFDVDLQAVNPGYFTTLGISLLKGRSLTPADRKGTLPVALVNRSFVRKFLAGQDPLQHRIRRGPQSPWISIVGIVSDIRRDGKTSDVVPEVYFAAAQTDLYPVHLADFAIRAQGDPRKLLSAIQQNVWAIDKDLPLLMNAKTLDEIISASVSHRRFQALLIILFAGIALVLALVGIYGVISYSVAQRTAEIGIRVALGAQRKDILGLVLRQASIFISVGIFGGIAGAFGLSRYLSSSLFAIKPSDPATYIVATILLACVALIACLVPARRAARTDPIVALRYE